MESLVSYLIRISNRHNVLLGDLINKLIVSHIKKDYLIRSSIYGGNRFYDNAKTINGYSENSCAMVKVLESLTGRNDLMNLTLSKWNGVISLRNLLKKSIEWCPECIKDWRKKEKEVYYPLIWSIKAVTVCIHHNIYLQKRCLECSETVDVLHRRSVIGYCSKCFAPLDQFRNKEMPNNTEVKYQKYVIQNINELLWNIHLTTPNVDIKTKLAVQLLRIKEKFFSSKISEFSAYLGVPKGTLRSWINGQITLSLDNLLLVGYKLNCSISHLIFTSDQIDTELTIVKEIQTLRKNSSSRKPVNRPLVKNKLEAILLGETPISMKAAASVIGHDRRVLYKNFPDQCRLISYKYREFQNGEANKRIAKLKEQINIAFCSLRKKNIYPSRRKIEASVNKKGLLKEKVLQEYWKLLLEGYK